MDFLEFIKKNERVVIAEGVLFELVRRCKVRLGSFVPEAVLDSPESVKMLHQEFVDTGSDVVQAFTYYGHRKKLREIGREEDLEPMNKKALEIAKEVARENGKLFAGGLCNTNIYDPDDLESIAECEAMFAEQCQWAKDAGVDFMIAETFWDYGEASLALRVLKRFGLVSVVSICPVDGAGLVTFDNVPIPEALRRLEEEGADVVALNCQRGPRTMIPLIEKCKAVCKGPIGCLPVCFNTTEEAPTMSRFKYPGTDKSCYPNDTQIHTSSFEDIKWFAQKSVELGLSYVGLCCGNDPRFMQTFASALGRPTKQDKFASDRESNSLAGGDKNAKRSLKKFTMM